MNRTSVEFDVAVIGAGVMGCSTAFHLAQGGMKVALVDRGQLCREASGVNAGTLTLHMTRAALVPYAMKAWEMWMTAEQWLGAGVLATKAPGLTLAFTEAECDMLEERAAARRSYGAEINILTPQQAQAIEPGLNPNILKAAHCDIDGYASAYLTGQAFHHGLRQQQVQIFENHPVVDVHRDNSLFEIITQQQTRIRAKRIVLAGGVWIEPMLAWLGVHIPIKTLINQLTITERIRPVMQSVVSVANGLLSLKQFANGTVLIGGGWQGIGDRENGAVEAIPENLIGNMRLARYVIPELSQARIARVWLGLEAETADAMPIMGSVPDIENAYVVGSAHSGYTSGPFMGKITAQYILGQEPDMPLFDPARLLNSQAA